MGIYDRDYYRQTPRGGFGSFAVWSVTTWLIAINVVVFFVDGIAQRSARREFERRLTEGRDQPQTFEEFERLQDLYSGPVQRFGHFSVSTAVFGGQVWRFITFQFLHASPGHIFGNMLALFFFGPIVEGQFGPRRYLFFYLLCGIAGPVMYIALWASGVLIGGAAVPMVGASAGVFGVLMAAARLAPDMEIILWFPPIPVPLRVLAWVAMGGALYAVMTSGHNAGGEAAHLGGGILGFALVHNQHWLNFAVRARRATVRPRRRRRLFQKDWSKDMNR